MPTATIPAPSVPLSQVGRAAHDLGLAGMLGGNLYGRFALHPAVRSISSERERGAVVNAALAQQSFRRPSARRLLGRRV